MQTKAEYTASLKKQVDQLLTLIYALLAVSVIISVFGIVNTLVLSVYERTREIGMLRAIGTSRRQMRRIVRYESVITSVIGGVLGTVLGVLFAYVVTSRLASQGIMFSVPWASSWSSSSWPPSSAWSPPCCRRAAPPASTSSTPSTTNDGPAGARAGGVTGRTAQARGGWGG